MNTTSQPFRKPAIQPLSKDDDSLMAVINRFCPSASTANGGAVVITSARVRQPIATKRLARLFIWGTLISVSTIGDAQVSQAAPVGPAAHPAAGHAAAPVKKTYQAVGPSQAVCTAYLGRLRAKLVNNWYLPDGSNNVTLTMTVGNDGSTGDIKPASNPQNAPAESAAMEALTKCQPLEALPSGFLAGAKLTIVFVSKADPHGDSNSSVNLHIDPNMGSKSDIPSAAAAPASAGAGAPDSGSAPAASAPAAGTAETPSK